MPRNLAELPLDSPYQLEPEEAGKVPLYYAGLSSVTQVLKELAGSISKALDGAADLSTDVPGLARYRNTAPTAPNPCTYEPSLLLIPQGKKRVDLGKQSYVFGESTFLLTSIELPIVSRVSVASVEKPYCVGSA